MASVRYRLHALGRLGIAYFPALSTMWICHQITQFQWIHHWTLYVTFVWFLHLFFCQHWVGDMEKNSLFCYYFYQWLLDYLYYLNLKCQLHLPCPLSGLPASCVLFVHWHSSSVLVYICSFCVCMSVVLQLIIKMPRVSMSMSMFLCFAFCSTPQMLLCQNTLSLLSYYCGLFSFGFNLHSPC